MLNGAVLALVAISATVVCSTVRTLNLAHADVFALTTALLTTTLIGIGVQAAWLAQFQPGGTRIGSAPDARDKLLQFWFRALPHGSVARQAEA